MGVVGYGPDVRELIESADIVDVMEFLEGYVGSEYSSIDWRDSISLREDVCVEQLRLSSQSLKALKVAVVICLLVTVPPESYKLTPDLKQPHRLDTFCDRPGGPERSVSTPALQIRHLSICEVYSARQLG